MDFTPYASAIVSALVAIIGSYMTMRSSNDAKFSELKEQNAELKAQNAQQTAEIRALKEQAEKHNGVLERVFKLEQDVKTAYKRIDELKERDDKLEAKIER